MGRSSTDRASRLAGIEGLRAVAATSIVVYHVYLYGAPDGRPVDMGPLTKVFDNLRAGVTLFFVLSGFLLYRVFVAAALRGRPMPSVRNYLRNRALRIVPAYWAILVGVVVVFQHDLLTRPLQLGLDFLFLQNYVPGYVVTSTEDNGIVPAWSVVIEVSFYLVLPILGYLAIRLAGGRTSTTAAALVPVALMLLAGLWSKALIPAFEEGSDAHFIVDHSLPTHADWFAAGMAVAVARVLWEDGRLRLPPLWRTAAVVAALGIALVGTKLYYAGTITGLDQQTPIAIACALVLAVVVLGPADSLLQRSLGLRVVVLAGLVSYSLFLVHDPLVRGFRDWGLTLDGRSGFAVNLLLIGGVSFVLAALTYRFVEKPALGRKRRWQEGDEAGLGSSAPADELPPAAPTPLRPAVAAGPIVDDSVGYRLQISPHTDTTERGPTT